MKAMQKVLREAPGGRLESRVTKRGFRARVLSSIWRPVAYAVVIVRDDLLSSLDDMGEGHR